MLKQKIRMRFLTTYSIWLYFLEIEYFIFGYSEN